MPDYPVRVSVQLSEADYAALLKLANEADRSVAYIIREAVRAALPTAGERPKPG